MGRVARSGWRATALGRQACSRHHSVVWFFMALHPRASAFPVALEMGGGGSVLGYMREAAQAPRLLDWSVCVCGGGVGVTSLHLIPPSLTQNYCTAFSAFRDSAVCRAMSSVYHLQHFT